MKDRILLWIYGLLFLCCSMYVGTGGSMVLFTFPVEPKLTVDNYYLVFVPEVAAATRFFTGMTSVMIAASIVMLIAEWRSRLRWAPIVVLSGVVIATALTLKLIFPLNDAMSAGITDQAQLQSVLARWMTLNKWRVFLWLIQWLAMMWYFVTAWSPAYRTRAGQVSSTGLSS